MRYRNQRQHNLFRPPPAATRTPPSGKSGTSPSRPQLRSESTTAAGGAALEPRHENESGTTRDPTGRDITGGGVVSTPVKITLMRTAATVALAAVLPLAAPAAAETSEAAPTVLPIDAAVAALQSADESRAGYGRTAFKHWTSGDNPTDGCNTRQEVLLAEATIAPEVGPRCAITGGTWLSYYDEVTVEGARGLDIDHMVPLAEAWDSK